MSLTICATALRALAKRVSLCLFVCQGQPTRRSLKLATPQSGVDGHRPHAVARSPSVARLRATACEPVRVDQTCVQTRAERRTLPAAGSN